MAHGRGDWAPPLLFIDSIESLFRWSPETLAKEVLKQRNIGFLGIAGFSVSVPGVEIEDRCMFKPTKVYVIPGTSDILTARQAAIQEKATAFAVTYNRIIRDHVVSSGALKSYLDCAQE